MNKRAEFSNTVRVIEKIHNIQSIPDSFYDYLYRFKSKGYTDKEIKDKYVRNERKIDWVVKTKKFKNDKTMLKYTLHLIQ